MLTDVSRAAAKRLRLRAGLHGPTPVVMVGAHDLVGTREATEAEERVAVEAQ